MFLVDVNFLVAAHRADHVHNHPALSVLKQLNKSAEIVGLCDVALAGFLRVSTHSGIFAVPSSLEIAFQFLNDLLELPNAVRLSPGPDHWKIFSSLCRQIRAQGSIVTDAYLAALAHEHGYTLVSFDKDFARFPGLRWHNPLKS